MDCERHRLRVEREGGRRKLGRSRRQGAAGDKGVARRRIAIDAVYDIETQDWTTFVLGGIRDWTGAFIRHWWQKEETLIDHLLDVRNPDGNPGVVWAHNGGRFDHRWLVEHIIRRDIRCTITASGAGIIKVQVKDGPTFVDSKLLAKVSLEDFTKGLGVEKQRLELPCICGEEDCRRYCAIRRGMPMAHRRLLESYHQADCESLWQALERLQAFADAEDLDLGVTVGGSAWANARRLLELPDAELPRSDHDFAREAYKGGRVQVLRPFTPHGSSCDVNSMYMGTLKNNELPTGAYARTMGADIRHAYNMSRLGIYRAIVHVPEMHLPPLAIKRRDGRTGYPFGKLHGTWTLRELEYAESLGCTVEVQEGLVWKSRDVVFRRWVEKIWALRFAATGGKSGPMGTFLKFYGNSLTGKLGSDPLKDLVCVNPDTIKCCVCPGECVGCGGHAMFEGSVFLYTRKINRLDACCHVEWAAMLTADARIELHRQLASISDGIGGAYLDTDSCFSVEPRTRNMGSELGQWQAEGEFRDLRCIAPKVYTYSRGEKRTTKGKGFRLPDDAEKAARLLIAGAPVVKSGVIGFRRGLRRAARGQDSFYAEPLSRRASVGYGDRILESGSETTRAPSAAEFFGTE